MRLMAFAADAPPSMASRQKWLRWIITRVAAGSGPSWCRWIRIASRGKAGSRPRRSKLWPRQFRRRTAASARMNVPCSLLLNLGLDPRSTSAWPSTYGPPVRMGFVRSYPIARFNVSSIAGKVRSGRRRWPLSATLEGPAPLAFRCALKVGVMARRHELGQRGMPALDQLR